MFKLPLPRSRRRRCQSRTKRRRLSSEPLEARFLLAASLGWDGPGQGSAELTYYIANSPNSLTQAETNAALETAFAAWSSAADITFTETDQPGLRDSIDISFTNIDGVGGTLAQAYFPDDVNPARIAGDVQFDISDAWEVGNSLGSQAFDLVFVAVHELGHSLGLDHSSELGSVLAPFVSANQTFTTLESSDALEIQELYASADGVTTIESPIDETPVDEAPSDEVPADESTNGETDSDDDPFPRRRWRRGGNWGRWGGRLDAESTEHNYVSPTDVNSDGLTSAIDALMVINQLSRGSEGEGVDIVGLCDTNGDGAITTIDALTVINSMGILSNGSSAEDSIEEQSVEEMESPTSEVDDAADNVDTVDDASDMVDGMEETADEMTDVVDETVDPVDGDDDNEVDEVEGDEQEIDDGGLLDDSDQPDDDDSDHCRHQGFGPFKVGQFGKDAETLVTHFDTNDDASLSEDEVSERLWAKLTELEVDGDADGLVTLAELEAAITAARQERYDERDADSDGLLVESEVSERLWSKISAADADADGGVSFDELEAFKAQQQADQGNSDTSKLGLRSHRRLSDEVFAAIGRAAGRR